MISDFKKNSKKQRIIFHVLICYLALQYHDDVKMIGVRL